MRAVVAVLFFVTAVHAATWGVFRDKQEAPDFKGILPSVSYAPFEGTAHPDVDNIPNVEKIRADMKKLAPLTRAIRLYSSTGGVELVPPIAAEFGIKVTLGAWIDKNVDRNEREIAAAIELAKRNSNVIGIVVGNETVFRGEQKVDGLIDLIKRVKSAINGRVPVTTGEIWNIWRDNPELGYSVDFIAAHVLPYWENFTDQQAVDPARSSRLSCCATLSPGPRRSAWITTSSRRSISPGSSLKAASGPIGAFSTRPASRNLPGPGRSSTRTTGNSPPSHFWSACCCRFRSCAPP